VTGPDEEIDPDILEELEAWSGPDDEADDEDEDEDDFRPESAVGPSASGSGSLMVVGTPIGNLGDLSPRAVEALAGADLIYCEDTRHSRKLLSHAGIAGASMRSLHQHNEHDRLDQVVAAVAGGSTVVLVSDAGMPGVSDPGSQVVAAVAAAGLTVSVIPGPSAVLAALVTSGLPTDRFCFEGFLPRSGRDRRSRLAAVASEARTSVLFEAPGRVAATLTDLAAVCGADRPVAVARELTKLHEQIWRGPVGEAAAWATGTPVRGEVAIVVGGAPAVIVEVEDGPLLDALRSRLADGERVRGAVDAVAAEFLVGRRRVYDLALSGRAGPEDRSPPTE